MPAARGAASYEAARPEEEEEDGLGPEAARRSRWLSPRRALGLGLGAVAAAVALVALRSQRAGRAGPAALRVLAKPLGSQESPGAVECPSQPLEPPPWEPVPASKCTSFQDKAKNCEAKCGNCFNPGARKGVMCNGTQPGYNCPSDTTGPAGGGIAFACLDWTFGSTAQRAAEASYNCRSGRDPVYFGVGTYGTSSDPMGGLGMCLHIEVEGLDRPLVAQSINTGHDVAGNQFDLQIGAGGAGAYNTCAGSKGSMFPGPKKVWGKQYGGLSHKKSCADLPKYPRESGPMKAAGESLVELCEYGFEKGVRHEGGRNPSILSIERVACPAELVNLTQIRRKDEPSEEQTTARRLKAAHKCGGTPGNGAAWCLTRMMDCRKPSGGFKDNVREELVVLGHRLVQPCTADGYTRMDVQCGCMDCYC